MDDELFDKVWKALVENGSSRKSEEAVRRFWATLSPKQKQLAADNIPRKVRAGKYVQYNPIQAIKENIRKYQLPEPVNYNGNSRIEDVAKTTLLVSARHNGHAGIYTLTDAIEHSMTICYGFNFNYEQYLKGQHNE